MNPSHIRIRLLKATKRTERDSYANGCDPASAKEITLDTSGKFRTLGEAFNELVGCDVPQDQIQTIDSNLYQDRRGADGKQVTVIAKDNRGNGVFRATYDRQENPDGHAASDFELGRFERGNLALYLATYEALFTVQIVGMTEKELAEFLGVSNLS